MRKTEEPKISFNMVRFSGDNAAFKSFMNGMIQDYLNPDTVHNIPPDKSVENVEVSTKPK